MSSMKVKLFMALESFLRVPPLLIVDEIFRISFGLGHVNKQGAGGNHPPQSTVFVPDKLELSKEERLDGGGTFVNETLASTSSSISKSQEPVGLVASFPAVTDMWQLIADALYQVFNPDSQQAAAASAAATSSVSTSTIVDVDTAAVTAGFTKSGLEGSADMATPQIPADLNLMKFIEFIFCVTLFFVAIITFMLATENLIKLYSHLLSFLSLYLTYIFAPFPALGFGTIPSVLYNILCRSLLAVMYYGCRSWPGCYNFNGGNTVVTIGTELLLILTFFLTGVMEINPVLYGIVMIGLHHPLVRCAPDIYAFLKASWNETKRVQNEYGLSHLIQVESGRLRVNTVFRLFWVTRAAYDAISKCCTEPLNSLVRYVMTHGTETFTGIVGLTVTVSAICHHIGEALLFLLYNGANTEADANRFGSISTVLFFILSLQTGLTSLDPEKRLDRLMKNIVLLGTALFHALHQMISPVLTAFRAFQTLQIRAAVLSCSFFFMSGCLTYFLLRHSTMSTWSLAVLALAIEFKIKICISLLISFVVYLSQLVQYPEWLEKVVHTCRRCLPTCALRFLDHYHDEMSHEDVVFYLRSFANFAEFVTGIFLFCNAIWIFFFESASAIRAIGMSVHAYFNIYCEAQKGYRIYSQRATAQKKIMSLADATEAQLRERQDDVCAVCYEEMESAKVTNCNHLFHAVCLRKWLYVQNTCPLCHEVLYREDALESNGNAADVIQLQPQTPNQNQNGGPRPPPIPSTSALASRLRSNQENDSSFEMVNPSDDNDTEPETSANGNTNGNASTGPRFLRVRRGGRSTSSRETTPLAVYNGIRFSESENGNSSSGTEFTVDDGSDEDWAEEFSSSDDDDDVVRRPRGRGDNIGVPLLL